MNEIHPTHSHHPHEREEHHAEHEHVRRPKPITLKIPRPNWQVTALLLITIIAGFQTIELLRLKGQLAPKASAAASTSASGAAASPTQSGSSSGLQGQVGGC